MRHKGSTVVHTNTGKEPGMTTTVCKRCAAEGFVGIDTEWCTACEQDYLDYEDYGQDVDYEIERI